MIYSGACAYAIRAMTRLAYMRSDGYVLLNELCEATDLPRMFIAKIFQELVRKQLLVSAKGRGGGFALARPGTEITVFDIVAAIDGRRQFDKCVVGLGECDDRQSCPLHNRWVLVRKRIKSCLTQTTLDDMSSTLARNLRLVTIRDPQRPVEP